MDKNKLSYGVGIQDANYTIKVTEYIEDYYPSGIRKQKLIWVCPYYQRWYNMLKRCYSEKFHNKHPTYKGCSVCEEWLLFSNFRGWVITQDWEGNQLDKDLLTQGNKVYSQKDCVFVCKKINTFVNDRGNARGKYLIGCSWDKLHNMFRSSCSNPFTGKQVNLGLFNTYDGRVKQVLLTKYKNYNIVEYHIR